MTIANFLDNIQPFHSPKKRPAKKRENHAAIERRRRDDINERLDEIISLIPDCKESTMKYHKGTILRKAINYMKFLYP